MEPFSLYEVIVYDYFSMNFDKNVFLHLIHRSFTIFL
jgi:hypothetical protein